MNMREKTARAMFDKGWKTGPLTWNAAGDGTRAEMYELADAALDALMSAPLEILIIGENVVTGSYGDAPDLHSAWLATIRAIKEGK